MIDAGATSPAQDTALTLLRAPFASRTWKQTLDNVLSLPIGVVSCSYVVALLIPGSSTPSPPCAGP